jgi:hypothetical protein
MPEVKEIKKVNKGVRVDEEAWHMAKVEATKRGIYMGDLLSGIIRWTLTTHLMTCPNCEKDFELYPPDYIEAGEQQIETRKEDA